jgi:hypothetical protein
MRASEIIPSWLLAEVGPAKPVKPLTPEQSRKRSAKQARAQQQTNDENARHVAKIRDLQARLP